MLRSLACLLIVNTVLTIEQESFGGSLSGYKHTSDQVGPQEDFQGKRISGQSKENDFESLIKALHYVQRVQKQMDRFSECKPNDPIILHITFDHSRWKNEATLALEVANLMTSLWREAKPLAENDTFLYSVVRSNVLFSKSVYGSVVCFERNQYRNYERFCPYAYRDKTLNNNIHIMDISVTHDYLTSQDTIWWRQPRQKALKMKLNEMTEHFTTRHNASTANPMRNVTLPVVQHMDEGLWTSPYFDCFGGKSWMVTFLAPFFNESNDFLGVVSIDIQLNDIDINQCDSTTKETTRGTGDKTNSLDSVKLNDFMGTHRCKKSTKCVNIPDQGFKRGSYYCECAKGFYYPSSSNAMKKFNGSEVEAEYDKRLQGLPNKYDNSFECIKCSEGCSECTDGRPCQYSVFRIPRILLLIMNGLALFMALGFGLLVMINREVKVFHSSSPLFLVIILTGAILMYIAVRFVFLFESPPNFLSCILFPWLQHIGFALAYGSLALKTWRVYRTFRVRCAHKVQVTDMGLLRHLAIIVAIYIVLLLVWTLTTKSFISTAVSTSGLQYKRCSTSWFDYGIVVCNVALLSCALWLCYRVRKAPSAYNENRFISWVIYNAAFVMCFFSILRGLTQKNTNPDIIYALEFVFVHMIATVMLLLIFLPKCIIIRKIRRRGVTTSFTSNNKRSGELSPNGTHLYVSDVAVIERENEDLKLSSPPTTKKKE
ncbi:hypothetical protein QZH41_019647, partial [Actinostola sp. cb2023]